MMKKIVLFFGLLMLSVSSLLGQEDQLEKIVQLASEKTRLEVELTTVKKERDSIQKLILEVRDKIDNKDDEISRLNQEKSNLEKEISRLRKDSGRSSNEVKKLQKEIATLRQDSIKTQKFRAQKANHEKELKNKDMAMESHHAQVRQKDLEIKTIKEEKSNAAKEATILAVKKIENIYTQPFDALVLSATKESLERDRRFLKEYEKNLEDKMALRNLDFLVTFFEAQYLLIQPYEKSKINAAISKLKESSPDSQNWKNLIKTLENYEKQTNALKEALDAIKKIDTETVAN